MAVSDTNLLYPLDSARLLAQANHWYRVGLTAKLMFAHLRLSVCSTLSPLGTLARKMMKRHWAPTILDGHAYHGRPQKPRRLILVHCLGYEHGSVESLLTIVSSGRGMLCIGS
ncbi:hypothetical protein DE146DRAFT_46980 [Phaeosphaeria sp. MPI-PUGE-AT-0046c]|nr:hypothetical protein DE146DRAFT_46980 [Phaeosphaeria sp. MPI-PUGE-AT-0046c]